jgi:hypothetical protein
MSVQTFTALRALVSRHGPTAIWLTSMQQLRQLRDFAGDYQGLPAFTLGESPLTYPVCRVIKAPDF